MEREYRESKAKQLAISTLIALAVVITLVIAFVVIIIAAPPLDKSNAAAPLTSQSIFHNLQKG